jgi:hypothetical protein
MAPLLSGRRYFRRMSLNIRIAQARRAAAEKTLRELDRLLTDEDKRAIRQAEVDLYDDHGLPR